MSKLIFGFDVFQKSGGRQLALGNKAKAPATPGANSFRSRGITGDIPFDPRGFGRDFPGDWMGTGNLSPLDLWIGQKSIRHAVISIQPSDLGCFSTGCAYANRYPGVPMRIPIGTLGLVMGMPQGMPAYRCVWLGILN